MAPAAAWRPISPVTFVGAARVFPSGENANVRVNILACLTTPAAAPSATRDNLTSVWLLVASVDPSGKNARSRMPSSWVTSERSGAPS